MIVIHFPVEAEVGSDGLKIVIKKHKDCADVYTLDLMRNGIGENSISGEELRLMTTVLKIASDMTEKEVA